MIFYKCYQKSSWTTFKTISETLSALGACHVTIIGGGGGIQEIHDFQGIWSISQRIFDISS